MGNSFGRLCSGSRFKGEKKRYITATDETLRLEDGEGNIVTIEDFDKENIEDTDKVKEKSKMIVPRLDDGYMTVNEFKKCMLFLSQPHVEIPDSAAALEKPDFMYAFITDVENADDAAMEQTADNPLKNKQITSDYQQRVDSEEKRSSTQEYANEAKIYTMSRQVNEVERNIFISLPNLSIIEHKSMNQYLNFSSRKTSKFHGPTTREIVFTDTDESTESMDEVIDGVYESEHHQMQTLKLKSTRRNSGTSESSTDSGQSSCRSSSSETRLKLSRSDRKLCSSNCSKCRTVYMEYMVEVYKQLIVRQIKVTDILDFLNVLDDRSKEMLRSKHIQSPHGAMELLIEIIKRSHSPGKWQCLYDAIEASEFTYISMLLKEETEIQYDYSTDVLELVKPEIKSRIYLPDFLDKVFERQLVTEAEKDEANSFSDLEAKIFILDRIDKHLPNWNHVLVEVLNDSFMDDLAALFILVSRNNEDNTPTPKECDIRSYRRALRRRRKHIMKIAHGNTNNEATSCFQAKQLSSLNNAVRGETVAISEYGMILEKSVTDLTTTIDKLKIRLRNSESAVETTFLQDLKHEQSRLNNQQEYICSEIGNIRKDMSDMKELLKSVAR